MRFYVIGEKTPRPALSAPVRSLARLSGPQATTYYERSRSNYPGLDAVLDRARRMVQQWRADARLRNLALRITRDLPADFSDHPDRRQTGAIAQAVYEWVTTKIAYVRDPYQVEQLQDPFVTITSGAGDCDDHVVLVCALLQAMGIECQFYVIRQRGYSAFNHIVSRYKSGGEWKVIDTTEPGGAGATLPTSTFAETKTVDVSGGDVQQETHDHSADHSALFWTGAMAGSGVFLGIKMLGWL